MADDIAVAENSADAEVDANLESQGDANQNSSANG